MVACTLPQLIAACHVLHRLHAPRHPPCALSSLTIKFAQSKLLPRSSIEPLEINYFLANHAQLTCACFPNIVVSESSQITYSVVKHQFPAISGKATIICYPQYLSIVCEQKIFWVRVQAQWRRGDSNPWPQACKARALPNWATPPSDISNFKFQISNSQSGIPIRMPIWMVDGPE